MVKHLIHSHLDFQLLLLSFGLVLTFLVLYVWFCWREERRQKTPKYSKNLQLRLLAMRQKLKHRHHNDKGRVA
ncbi:MAG: hypothetical protein D3M94_14295 [Rhodocyclales bacterium GT-UBC]|nr:MAG: hypothetical protein D3M94_14295 [Rhodocyclales bacterium GT-UBC]